MFKKIIVTLTLFFCFMACFKISSVAALELNEEAENPVVGEVPEETLNETSIAETEEEENEIPPVAAQEYPEDTRENEPEIPNGEIYDVHMVAVIITKVDENKNPLVGAVLQILDSEGNVIEEWTSDGNPHEIMLTDGDYTLHEVEAPVGYDLAEDQEFTVKAEIVNLNSGVDFSTTPCGDYGGTPLYYVEIEGKKHEVYCINQDWETPDGNSIYDGEILNSTDIKNYTQQTTYIDAHGNTAKIDVSDPTLDSSALYNKILDIIYHRHNAVNIFSDLTEAEIRYVTEAALKNYTNAGLTRVQRVAIGSAPAGYENLDYYVTDDGKYIWYLYPWYRSFVYNPTKPLGKDIFITSFGNGDSFGNLARHWSTGHNAKNSAEVRAKVARFYELYLYLINDADHHPDGMHLYIYSTDDLASKISNYNFDEGAYQNLLGITGYFEDVAQQKQEIEMINKYKVTKVDVKKVWEDCDDSDKVRPTEIKVFLYADGEMVEQATLNEKTGWTYSFTNLPVFKNGKKITYSVSEESFELTNLADLYDVVITGNAEEGFVITNYYSPKGDVNPPTLDKIYLSVNMLVISSLGLILCMSIKRKNYQN